MRNILFAVLVILVLGIIARSNAQRTPPYPSSGLLQIDTPKQYIYRITIDAGALYRINFINDSLMREWGMEKGGSEIKKAQQTFDLYNNYWKKLAVLDSLPVSQKNINKQGK